MTKTVDKTKSVKNIKEIKPEMTKTVDIVFVRELKETNSDD